jgi:hypothetical protein
VRARSTKLAAVAAALVIVGIVSTSAQAAPPVPPTDTENGCPPDSWVDITSKATTHIPDWSTHEVDGPGGTMTATVTKTSIITTSMSTTIGVTASEVLASSKIEVSGDIAASVRVTTGHTYSHNIRPGYYGHLAYGSRGYVVHWTKYVQNGSCHTTSRSGTATLPTNAMGWNYWETK